jgi:hypothetical protein
MASAWDLPISPESNSSSDVSEPPPLVVNRRGRPPGIRGSAVARQLRDQILDNHGIATVAVNAASAAALHGARAPAPTGPRDALSVRMALSRVPVQQGILHKMAEASSSAVVTCDEEVERLLADVFGQAPRTMMGLTAHAAAMHMPRTTCRMHTLDIASAVHYGSRVWMASMFSSFLTEVALGTILPEAAFSYILYDETPLPLRTLMTDESLDPTLQTVTDTRSGPDLLHRAKHKGLTKVVQSEAMLSIVFQVVATKDFMCW